MGFNLNIPAKSFVVNNFCILWPTLNSTFRTRRFNDIHAVSIGYRKSYGRFGTLTPLGPELAMLNW